VKTTWQGFTTALLVTLAALPAPGATRGTADPATADAGLVPAQSGDRDVDGAGQPDAEQPDAGATALAPPGRTPPLDALAREVEALRLLVAGEPDPTVDAASLFEVRLSDDRAVSARAASLQAQLAEQAPLDAGSASPEPSDGRALAHERLRLRLTFLSLDPERRASILAEATRRRSSSRQQAEARATARSAAEDERRAEAERRLALDAARDAASAAEAAANTALARALAALERQAALRGELAPLPN
jgi:hypothetical protein